VKESFTPEVFAIKLTVLNPTATGRKNGLAPIERYEKAKEEVCHKASEFEACGFEVIQSVGNMEENEIGSNCGQAIRKMKTHESFGLE
jgi:23S rRNA (adenine2503-C2)-methyltransferase